MKNKNNFRVQMMRVIGDLAPFVRVEYVDQDANVDQTVNVPLIAKEIVAHVGQDANADQIVNVRQVAKEIVVHKCVV